MKILMFGWEFPPHISGGLGTACYGLTKGLSEIEGIELTFVVPKAFGDEDQSAMKLIGANTVPVSYKNFHFVSGNKNCEFEATKLLILSCASNKRDLMAILIYCLGITL